MSVPTTMHGFVFREQQHCFARSDGPNSTTSSHLGARWFRERGIHIQLTFWFTTVLLIVVFSCYFLNKDTLDNDVNFFYREVHICVVCDEWNKCVVMKVAISVYMCMYVYVGGWLVLSNKQKQESTREQKMNRIEGRACLVDRIVKKPNVLADEGYHEYWWMVIDDDRWFERDEAHHWNTLVAVMSVVLTYLDALNLLRDHLDFV